MGMMVGMAEGVKMVAAVTEGAGCSVCFVHVWGKREGKGWGSRFMYIHCTSHLGTILKICTIFVCMQVIEWACI